MSRPGDILPGLSLSAKRLIEGVLTSERILMGDMAQLGAEKSLD